MNRLPDGVQEYARLVGVAVPLACAYWPVAVETPRPLAHATEDHASISGPPSNLSPLLLNLPLPSLLNLPNLALPFGFGFEQLRQKTLQHRKIVNTVA
jgi:hypothetical protein